MVEDRLSGLYDDVSAVGDAVEEIRRLGVPERGITVMSGVPYEPHILGRPSRRQWLPWVALTGALLGLIAAIAVLLVSYLLYPLNQGGQPTVPIPPMLIICFVLTMLGIMGVTFLGFVLLNRFPIFGRPPYDPAVTMGKINLVARVDPLLSPQVRRIMLKTGGQDVRLLDESRRHNPLAWRNLVLAILGVAAVAGAVPLLFFYDVLSIPFPSNMVHQESIAYIQGPRLAAPVAAIPIQGPALVAGQPGLERLPATDASLQRGQVLYGAHCALCHGTSRKGDGPLAGYFTRKPPDLTSQAIQQLPANAVYVIISSGIGQMPSLAENLLRDERWDVINYIHGGD